MKLPATFEQKMKNILGEEYKDFLHSFDQLRHYGLRINTLKWSIEEAREKLPFKLSPVDWAETGFYYQIDERPAKHPYYHAGLYYIQEPSAMAPGALLPVQPGNRVLDLCAAPGGKSTQIAARLAGRGVLVSNDISSDRIKALVKNLELFGVKNALVLNESPEKLADVFKGYFDCILVDAPCSGEGMFRKNPEMIKSWEQHNVEHCVRLQEGILAQAANMVREEGYMFYSTCTFAPEENERQIAHFLDHHPEFELIELPQINGFQRGIPQQGEHPMKRTVRLWPHHVQGEGHYLALLQKRRATNDEKRTFKTRKKRDIISKREAELIAQFEQHVLQRPIRTMQDGELTSFRGHVYLKPKDLPDLDGLKVIRSGWYLGEVKKNRFEPSQAFAMGLTTDDVQEAIHYPADDDQIIRYLKGETLHHQGKKGWKLVTVDGYPVGWGKQVDGFLKNAYPPGWRWMA